MRIKKIFVFGLAIGGMMFWGGGWLSAQHSAPVSLNRVIALFADADLDLAVEQCSELVFGETDPMTRARAYAMLALAYRLQDLPNATERIMNLRDLCADMDNLDRATLLPVLGYLAGQHPAAIMTAALDQATPDWQVFGIICRYVMMARENADPATLHALYQEHVAAAAIMTPSDWVSAWTGRVPHWQRCLQDKTARPPLEPLIAKRVPATAPLEDPAAAEQAPTDRRAAFNAINRVMDLYLDNDSPAAVTAARNATAELSGLSPEDAAATTTILGYLAGDTRIAREQVFATARTSPQVWLLGCLAMFVRDIAAADATQALDAVTLLHYLDNFHGNLHLLGDDAETVRKWHTHTKEWDAWCNSKFTFDPDLPPLLAKRSQDRATATTPAIAAAPTARLSELTAEEFAVGREERYGNRPRPSSLDFDANQFARYLATLPPELQPVEQRRFDVVAKFKLQLVKIFERNPWRGVIRLRNGSTRRGIIVRANENILSYKVNDKSRKFQRLNWADLSLEQHLVFFDHFARQRLAMSGGQVTPEERAFNAANDYLAMALFSDWFGDYEKSVQFAKKAVETSPGIEADAAALLLP